MKIVLNEVLAGRAWAQNTKHSICSVTKVFKIMGKVSRHGSFNCRLEGSWNTWHYISQLIGSDRPMLFFAYLKLKGLFSFWSWIFEGRLPQVYLELSSLAGSFKEWKYKSFLCVSVVLEAWEDWSICFQTFPLFWSYMHAQQAQKVTFAFWQNFMFLT